MANHKSAKKRSKPSLARNAINNQYLSKIRTSIFSVNGSVNGQLGARSISVRTVNRSEINCRRVSSSTKRLVSLTRFSGEISVFKLSLILASANERLFATTLCTSQIG